MEAGGGDSQPSPPKTSTHTSVIITCVVTNVIIILLVLWFAKRYYSKREITTTSAVATGSVLSSPSSTSESNSNLADGRVVLSSIPIFVYTLPTGEGRLDCSVCLGEFEDRERGRTLPTCHHSFHADCIETWFRSHATCPMCRSVVAPEPEPDDPQV